MLAPRKTLWSTPNEVVTTLVDWIPLRAGDVVLDVGCGDAKVLVQWAAATTTISGGVVKFVGIEIDEARSQVARENIGRAFVDGILDRTKVAVEIHCGNALNVTTDATMASYYQQATVVFLYLIPRGLRLIKPLLLAEAPAVEQLVTYMSPLPGMKYADKKSVEVEHQPGAAWPLYLYHSKELKDSQEDP
jgi:SAM-dependent methyltransferase